MALWWHHSLIRCLVAGKTYQAAARLTRWLAITTITPKFQCSITRIKEAWVSSIHQDTIKKIDREMQELTRRCKISQCMEVSNMEWTWDSQWSTMSTRLWDCKTTQTLKAISVNSQWISQKWQVTKGIKCPVCRKETCNQQISRCNLVNTAAAAPWATMATSNLCVLEVWITFKIAKIWKVWAHRRWAVASHTKARTIIKVNRKRVARSNWTT